MRRGLRHGQGKGDDCGHTEMTFQISMHVGSEGCRQDIVLYLQKSEDLRKLGKVEIKSKRWEW